MSWDRTQKHRRSLPLPTMNSMLSASSPTSAPPSLTTPPWTQRSTRGLGRQLQHSPVSRFECGLWRCPKVSVKTNMAVYNACVISTLLYGSETWTAYAGQERRLNTFHLRSIRHILGISWQDKVTNAHVLSHAGLPSMYSLLRQRRLRWLGHVRRMKDGRIPKDILYGELAFGRRTTGRPHL